MDFTYQFAKSLKPERPWHLELELSAGELKALGAVTAQWAILEYNMFKHMEFMTTYLLKEALPDDLSHKPFIKKLRYWRMIAKDAFANEKSELASVLEIIQRAGSLSDERHKLIHGQIRWNEANRKSLKVHLAKSPHNAPWKINKKRIEGAAFKMAVLNYDLLALHGGIEIAPFASPRRRMKPISLGQLAAPSSPIPLRPGEPKTRSKKRSPKK